MQLQKSATAPRTGGKARRPASSPRLPEIRFTIRRGRLGLVLIAYTSRGICAVLIGDDRDELRRQLAQRFSHVALTYSAPGQDGISAQAFEVIEKSDSAESLPPLDPVGTVFQRTVWNALLRIPHGSTVSYSQLAAQIGRPTASRAVASACAANPIAVLIPCHRVVGADGRLTGYRWGIERKRKLLEFEKKAARAVDFADSRSTSR